VLPLTIALVALAAPAGDPAGRIVICSDPWPPYVEPADAAGPGFVPLALSEALWPRQVEVVRAPWSRCLADLWAGRVAGAFGLDEVEARRAVTGEEEIAVGQPAFFTRPESTWRYQGPDSLALVRIGLVQDYTFGEEIDAVIRRAAADRVVHAAGADALERLVRMLDAGRIDVLVDHAAVVRRTAARVGLGPDRLREAGSIGRRPRLFVGFSPARAGSAGLAAALDEGLRRLRASGRLAELLSRHGIADWRVPAAEPRPPGRTP
jgi:polar amino acid transport system substrate-binding protein